MIETVDQLTQRYTNTIIDASDGSVAYGLISILFEITQPIRDALEQIKDLNDLNNLFGVQIDKFGAKWLVSRSGRSDSEYLDAIIDQIIIHYSDSTLSSLINILDIFEAPVGSTIEERLPPETAEINVTINGASTELFNRIINALGNVKAAGVEIDGTNTPSTASLLLTEDDDNFVFEDGDYIEINE